MLTSPFVKILQADFHEHRLIVEGRYNRFHTALRAFH